MLLGMQLHNTHGSYDRQSEKKQALLQIILVGIIRKW